MKKKYTYKLSLEEQRDILAIRTELHIAKMLEQQPHLGIALLHKIPENYRWAPWRCL